ncbi:hypothetical protein JCM10212_006988 [Sporobolomyces blumeae]
MLASYLAPYITGRYDVEIVPLSLPTPLVTYLLPSLWSETSLPVFLSPDGVNEATGNLVPDPGQGRQWVVVQAGQQISTGVGFGPGRKTFYEAKLEIPFLRHPSAKSSSPATPFTYKHTILFSSRMMALSSQHLSGLTSHRVAFDVDDATYQAEGYLSVRDESRRREGGDAPPDETTTRGWGEDLVGSCFEGWFVGEQTGDGATRFEANPLSPPEARPSLHVRLNLPTLTSLPRDALEKLLGATDSARLDEQGWYDVERVPGWKLSVATRMQVERVDRL